MLQLESEADVVGSQNFQKARQADSSFLHTWEVAGASHVDQYANNMLNVEFGHQFPDETAPQCKNPINSFPFHYAEQSAWFALKQRVRSGTLPPGSPQIAIEKRQIVLDSYGNAESGLSLPDLDVPIAAYGISNAYVYKSGSIGAHKGRLSCTSLGNTAQFDTATLNLLYPSHSVYVSQYASAANAAAAAGFLLQADARDAVTAARRRNIPPAQ